MMMMMMMMMMDVLFGRVADACFFNGWNLPKNIFYYLYSSISFMCASVV